MTMHGFGTYITIGLIIDTLVIYCRIMCNNKHEHNTHPCHYLLNYNYN